MLLLKCGINYFMRVFIMKKFSFLLTIIMIFTASFAFANEKEFFQESMRTILETGGKVKSITDTLRPNTRLYIYKQLPSMKKTLSTSMQTINDIKAQAIEEISNPSLQTVLQDTAAIQLLTISVATELLEIYENNGAISEREYKGVVSKYEKEAKRLQRSLEKYKNM